MATSTVAEYLTHQLRVCGKTQKQVADEVGYGKPNVITMMKLGQTKVPIEKVPALSRALGVDPAHFLRIAMMEYEPEKWKVLQKTFGFITTKNERDLVEAVREATGNTDPRIGSDKCEQIGKLVQERLYIHR